MTTASTRAVIYTRLSQDRSGTKESPENQERACRQLAEQRGWEVIAPRFEDRDVSGYKKVSTPARDAAIKMIRQKQADVLIVFKLERLTRRGAAHALQLVAEITDGGGSFISCTEQGIDTSTPMGRGVFGVLASVAEQSSEDTATRVKLANEGLARRGVAHSGGRRCYGYDRQENVIPEEAAILREARERLVAGETLWAVAEDLNRRGVPSSSGGKWTVPSVTRCIKSPKVVGKRTHNGELYDGQWEAIFSQEEQDEFVMALGQRGRGRRPSQDGGYLMTGLIYCAECQSPMAHGRTTRDIYECHKRPGRSNCGKVSVTQDLVDLWMTDQLQVQVAKVAARARSVPTTAAWSWRPSSLKRPRLGSLWSVLGSLSAH